MTRSASRTRPTDGNQAYVSDYREQRTPVTFIRFFASTQRSGTFVAAIKESSSGRERYLQLDDAADIALFRDKLVPNSAIEVQGIGHDRHSMKLLVWLDGVRVDAHEYLAPSTTQAAEPVVDWPTLRRMYVLAFESALQVRDTLEVDRDKAEFDVNAAAAALFHRAMTLQASGRSRAGGSRTEPG
jgi:hypothetical protein